MNIYQQLLFCSLGVALSVIIPVLRRFLPRTRGGTAGIGGALLPEFWRISKPYVILGIYSLAVALIVIAFAGETVTDWRFALLLGYSSDSTLQKIKG